MVKNPPTNAGDVRDSGSIPGLERSPRERNEPTLGFLPGESHGQQSLVDCRPWGCKEPDTTETT